VQLAQVERRAVQRGAGQPQLGAFQAQATDGALGLGALRLVAEVLDQLLVPVLRLDLLADRLADPAGRQKRLGRVLAARELLDVLGQPLDPRLVDLLEVVVLLPSLVVSRGR